MSVTDHLRTLEAAGLIRQAGSGAPALTPEFIFRHALVQQAAYNTYLKNQRRRVHRAIAEVLEQASADPTQAAEPADLAYHCYEAGQWAKAVGYARQAGREARARYAPREAVNHFTLGLAAARELSVSPPADLLRLRGQGHEVLGDLDQAQADYTSALDAARAAGNWRDEWELLLDLGLLFASRDYSRTGDYYRQALRLAQAQGDEMMLAHSLNRLGNWHFNVGENLAALELHQEALAVFERQQAQRGLAETYDLLGMVQTVIGRTRQGKASYDQAIQLFREQDDRLGLISCLATLSEQGSSIYTDTAAYVAPRDEAVANGRLAVSIAREIGFRAGEAYALCSLASLLVSQGEYAEALPDVRAAMRIAEEIDHRQWQTFAYHVYALACLDLFQMDEARRRAELAYTMAQKLASAIWIAGTTAMLVLVHLERGELDAADTLLARHPMPDIVAPSLQARLVACMRAEVLLARGDPGRALKIVQALIATTPDLAPGQVVPRLWHLRGRLLAALGRLAEGIDDLQQACSGSRAQGTLPLVWRAQADLARLYALNGQAAEAASAQAGAQEVVNVLAANVPDAGWRAHFELQAKRNIKARA